MKMYGIDNTQMINAKDLFKLRRINNSTTTTYNEDIMNGLLDMDRTHLNDWGYHLLTKKSVLSLSSHLYEIMIPEDETAKHPPEEPAKPVDKPRTHRYRRTLSKNKKQAQASNAST